MHRHQSLYRRAQERVVTPRALVQHRLVGLDSTVFVYAFENHPEFGPACRSLLNSIQIGSTLAIASTLVLGELLVRPFRDNRPDIARRYTELLAAYPNLEQIPRTPTFASRQRSCGPNGPHYDCQMQFILLRAVEARHGFCE